MNTDKRLHRWTRIENKDCLDQETETLKAKGELFGIRASGGRS